MREHLLGYVLGALEADEQELVERRLEADPELRRLLGQLESRLGHLDSIKETHDPPADLGSRTCDAIWAQIPGSATRPLAASGAGSHRADAPHYRVSLPAADPPTGGRWSLADLLVGAAILLATAILLLPALALTRQNARLAQCQNNLRSLGISLASYSDHSGGRFPYVPTSGRHSAAGIYAPMLWENEYVEDPNWFVCPSSSLARQREKWRLISLREIEDAAEAVLARLHEDMGGSYAYTLGYMEDGEHVAPRNLGRANYALLADAPCSASKGRQSPNHGGCGQNVLFEDLSVRYIVGCTLAKLGDDIFQNRDGKIAAGIDCDDSVLATSATPPLR